MIKEKCVVIANGMGGPNGDSIPVYGDNKAPRGGWAYDMNGKQLMWKNGDIRIIVDPEYLLPTENEGQRYYNFKPTGEKNYCQIWLVGEDGHGATTQPFWVEFDKLADGIEPPPPPTTKKVYKVTVEEWPE